MLRTKPEVDRHVAKSLAKVRSDREKCMRGYSIARLYFEIGEYDICVRYLVQYLTAKDNNAAAHNLLGQSYRKLGRKEEALAEFKTSLELDSNQNNLILKVCELLSEETMNADPGCMRYWVDRAGVTFPRHPTVFRLNQRLLLAENADSSTITTLLKDQIASRPSHPPSHARLLQHLLQYKQVREAFDYACDIHTSNNGPFEDSFVWLDAIVQVVEAYKSEVSNSTELIIWNYWLLYLTVLERKTYLQLKQSNTPTDVISILKSLDRVLYDVSVCQKLVSKDHLLKHFGGQFCLYSGSVILMKALHNQISWREAVRFSTPFFLLAFQIESPSTHRKDLSSRWSSISSYRMSQAGHTISTCFKEKKRLFQDNASQYFSEKSWRNKLYKDLFGNGDNSKMSYILNPKSFIEPSIKFPNLTIELQQADLSSRVFTRNSLHLQTWIGLNVEKLSKMTSLITDELPWDIDNLSNCAPETLCKSDIDAFLYCTILIAQINTESSRKLNSGKSNANLDRPNILPEVLMEPLCSAEQAKWWECIECSLKRDSGCQSSDIRSSLIRGIETVRCVGNHGIDPFILHAVAKLFSQRAEIDTHKKTSLFKRAKLYYENAVNLLEKLKDRISYNTTKNGMFNFVTKDISSEHVNRLIEEAKLFIGNYYLENNESERAITILTSVKSPYASYYLFQAHMKLADEQKDSAASDAQSNKYSLLSKARRYIYITLDKVKDTDGDLCHPLSEVIDECIGNVEKKLLSVSIESNARKVSENEYLSDQQSSVDDNNHSESTPIKYREPIHVSSTSSSIKAQLNELKKKEFVSESLLQQISALLESNKQLTEQVCEFKSTLNDIKSQNMNAVDRRKFFSSVDDIRCKVDELREESCINTMDLKKEINDLRKELEKLKLSSPAAAQRQDDSELLLLDEAYKNNFAALSYLSRVNNGNQTLPSANPYSSYPSNLYSLYAGQYPAFPQVFPPATLFPPDQTLYSDSIVPPQVPTQSAQPVIHDYHIPLPTQAQPVAPSILSSQITSTPNKPILDTRPNATALPKTSNIIDNIKLNSLFDNSKSNSIADASKSIIVDVSKPFSFSKDKTSENLVINKSRTLSEKSNDSYDPLPDYQPMVPLPDEIVPTTGEEGEEVMFDARAKLYRFITGEWKERGLGQLKLLKNENTGKVRLLMRRDIVHTVCANHIISPEMELCPMKGSDKAYFWVANDFADETVKLEKFSVRFKTVETGKQFFESFNNSKNQALNVISNSKTENVLSKNSPVISESKSVTTSATNSIGGFTFSSAPTLKVVEKNTTLVPTVSTADSKPNPFASFSFIKPPISTSAANVTSANTFQTSTVNQDTKVTMVDSMTTTTFVGWGDKFKPKAGSWNCSACYITNDSTVLYCVACDNPKDPGMPKKPEPKPTVDVSKFTFGFPAAVAAPVISSAPITSVTSVPSIGTTATTNSFKFGFGVPSSTPATTFTFNPQITSPSKIDNQPFILGAMDNTKYEFAFTPKSVPKSPNKSLNESVTDDNDTTQEDEGHHIFFEPVVPMPDKVEVKTGEEDEEVLYVHRAKLFRFSESEWKECGVGDVKILQHRTNKKIRLLMRREPVMKICLNHFLSEEINYTPKDEKSWLFSAFDYSTGEICPQQFCIRFINKGVAEEFKTAVENAKKLLTGTVIPKEVEFINESEVTDSELKEARKLMLPDKFHSYKNLPPCTGCRGCETENSEACVKVDSTNDTKPKCVDENKPFSFNFNIQTSSETPIANKSIFSSSSIPTAISGTGLAFGSPPTFNMANSTSIFNTATQSPFNAKSLFSNTTNSAPTLEALLKNNQPKTVTFKADGDSNVQKDSTTNPTINFGVKTNIFGGLAQNQTDVKVIENPDKTKTNQKNPLIGENPVSSDAKEKQGNDKKSIDDDVVFVSESQVTDKEISEARRLMLPDKFYAYKSLPLCSGCRGCENETDIIKTDKGSTIFSSPISSVENKVSSGLFSFENFSLAKTTSESLFGGNTNPVTILSNFSGQKTPSIFGTTNTPVFGSGMIFGSKAQTPFTVAPSNVVLPTSGDKPQSESFFKPPTDTLSTRPFSTVSSNTQAVTCPTTQSSGLLERLLASGGITDKSTLDQNGGNKIDQDKSSTFWTTKTPFSFSNIDNKVTSTITDKSYENVSEDEHPAEDDGQHIFFKPLIPLPDEVEVKTGEEQEEVVYSHRSKLYRFADSEWKECGVGDVKILRHPETNKLRVLMRREPIMKVCLNHLLTSDVNYTVKDEKSWLFSACDFSTEVITPQQFCIRFGNKNVAQEFMTAINDARNKYLNSDNVSTVTQDKKEVADTNKNVISVPNEPKKVTNPVENVSAKPLVVAPKFTSELFSSPASEKTVVNNDPITVPPVFGAPKLPLFNSSFGSAPTFGSVSSYSTFENLAKEGSNKKPDEPVKWQASDNLFTLAANSNKQEENLFTIAAKQNQQEESSIFNNSNISFTWEGAGTPLFSSIAKTASKDKDQSIDENADNHDPQFKPIIPLPDKIDVVTGEEDEVVEFNQRCKLFRHTNGEWRERGIGEFKILHHPERGTYRMLMRQEQVHKVVLNQLITSELDMKPMTNSPKALMWAGLNYTDDEKGVVEKLAVRFRTEELVKTFDSKIKSLIENLSVPSDEILVTGVPEEFIRHEHPDHDGDDDSDNCDESYNDYYNYGDNS